MFQSLPSSSGALQRESNASNVEVPGAFVHSADAATAAAAPLSTVDGKGDALTEEALQDAALAIPDAYAMSVSSLHTTSTDRLADEETAVAESSFGLTDEVTAAGNFDVVAPNDAASADTDTQHELDMSHLLGLSGQGLSAVNSATSAGFAAARTTTSYSLAIAKRFTQGLLALPAMALDGTLMGNTPSARNYADDGEESASIAQLTHKAVGGLFDVISTLALGGIDLGTAVTGAGLGAAVSGVEGVRRALGSEVLRSLGAFSRLVRREWNSASDGLPPGGIPGYSILGITQAMTAWVSIQMVTREYYEKRMLANLDVVDLDKVHAAIRKAAEEAEREQERQETEAEAGDWTFATAAEQQDDDATSTIASVISKKKKRKHIKKKVRILDDEVLPGDEGDVIDAEIGSAADAAAHNVADQSVAEPQDTLVAGQKSAPPVALTNEEAIAGLKRYSRLVLGVYGGVALAWLGSLPPDLMEAAGSVVEGGQQQQQQQQQLPTPTNDPSHAEQRQSILTGRPHGRSAAQDDADEFLRAAASLDLDEDDLIEDEAENIAENESAHISTPGTGASTPRQKSTTIWPHPPSSSDVLFSADSIEPSPAAAATTPARSSEAALSRNWSYYDILMGTADQDLFHRLGGLEHGTAMEGDYKETASQAGSAAERLRRTQNRVARPSKPRYYVVTDHTQRKVVLVLRGSLTLGDIAIDLTCESANFDVHGDDADASESGSDVVDDSSSDAPAPAEDFSSEAMREKAERRSTTAEERRRKPQAREYERSAYIVHEGMYETAKEIGEPGRPVHRAVRRAMLAHPGYALDITGHSLGAGVASLLALMWASPESGLTVKKSGLPVGRRTHAYCFAVPCVMGAKLGKRAEPLVTSFCYSFDLVCRLSLGAILDIRNACAWLAYENAQPAAASSAAEQQHYGLAQPLRLVNVMQRAFVHQSGRLNANDKAELEADFLALRKTLEANMTHVELYPPGTVLYSLPAGDVEEHLLSAAAKRQTDARLQARHGSTSALHIGEGEAALAQNAVLYRLRDDASRDEVFGQIINGRGMLSRHMPHLYHAAIDAL